MKSKTLDTTFDKNWSSGIKNSSTIRRLSTRGDTVGGGCDQGGWTIVMSKLPWGYGTPNLFRNFLNILESYKNPCNNSKKFEIISLLARPSRSII